MNQPAVVLWNKCILMRGAWQPQGRSTRAHLLLPSPPPAWLLHAAQTWVPAAKDAALGHTAGSTLQCSPVLPQAKLLWNVYQGVPAGMRQGNLLDAACVIWAAGDPVVGFLHLLSVSPWRCQKAIEGFAKSNRNFVPVSLVEKINCIKQCD